jgi:hypothetical protein
VDLDDVADALYALDPDEFVPTRDAEAARARAAGERALAGKIRALRKPTVAGWLANQVARRYADDVAELVGVGDRMRAATAARDGVALRELGSARRVLVDRLVTRGGEVAGSAGRPLSDDVVAGLRSTFEAAVLDRDAARSLQAGRLVRALQHVGFGAPGESADGAAVIRLAEARASRPARPASPASPVTPARPATPGDKSRRRVAEKAVSDAAAAVQSADADVDALAAELDRHQNDLAEAQARAERLRRELQAATSAVDQTRSAIRQTRQRLQAARAEAQKARRRHDRARRDTEDIGP